MLPNDRFLDNAIGNEFKVHDSSYYEFQSCAKSESLFWGIFFFDGLMGFVKIDIKWLIFFYYG